MGSKRSFKLTSILWIVVVSAGLGGVVPTYGLSNDEGEKLMDTGCLGGVAHPTGEQLAAMHKLQKVPFLQDYILHARGGKMTKVVVEKSRLPHDPAANPQYVQAALAPDGTVYVTLATIICKSTNGGQTWTSQPRGPDPAGFLTVLRDGTFITMRGGGEESPEMAVCASSDEGRTWRQISHIPIPPEFDGGGASGLLRLPDDTLIARIGWHDHKFEDGKYISGTGVLVAYRSSDRGVTWKGPSTICEWGSEGGTVQTASGKLLAVIRYQRPLLPDDPPDLVEQMRGMGIWPYKHVFLADSQDEGRTWQNFRQLTTVFGQTRGYPAALSDGTVVVVHDTRYGPGAPGSRAMISYDEGETWEDEVYYLDYTTFTGSYNASVVLEDDVIVAIVGSSDAGNSWEAVTGNTDFTAIRWKPVKPAQKQKAE